MLRLSCLSMKEPFTVHTAGVLVFLLIELCIRLDLL